MNKQAKECLNTIEIITQQFLRRIKMEKLKQGFKRYYLVYENDGQVEQQHFDKLEEVNNYTSKHVDEYMIIKMEVLKVRS